MGTMTLQKGRHVSCENTATATVGRTTEQRTVVVWRAVAATVENDAVENGGGAENGGVFVCVNKRE